MLCRKCEKEIPEGAVFCPWCGVKQAVPQRKPKSRGNGTGSVYRSGKTWTAEVTLGYTLREDGTMKRVFKRKKGFATKKEAHEYIPLMLPKTPQAAADEPAPVKITLEQYWKIYSENKLAKLSSSKQGHYQTAHRKIPEIMVADVRTLTIGLLQQTVNDVAPTYYPAKDLKTLLSHLFDLAMADQVVTVNLAEHIELPKMDEEQPNPFTAEEIAALWKDYAAGNTITGYALLMIYTGMMPGELFALTVDRIDLDNKLIVGAGLKTKKRKQTPMVLADCLLPVVIDLIGHAKGDKLLPMREDAYRQEFKAMLARCGCRPDLVPYSCRHTTATGLALENIALPVIKEVMRHTKITTTERYIHIDATPMLEAVNTLRKEAPKG